MVFPRCGIRQAKANAARQYWRALGCDVCEVVHTCRCFAPLERDIMAQPIRGEPMIAPLSAVCLMTGRCARVCLSD
jgi:hypothetical protein